MIRKLQVKMVAIIMAVLLLVFAVVFVIINVYMQRDSIMQTNKLLEQIVAQDGLVEPLFPGEGSEGLPPQEDISMQGRPEKMLPGKHAGYFYVKLDADGSVLETNISRMFDLTEEAAQQYAISALEKQSDNGSLDQLQYLYRQTDYGTIVAFAERSIEVNMLQQLLQISMWAALFSGVILFVVSILLSRWMVKPVKTAFAQQRRFVSDASHELKTPLTIIAANADVLEHEIGPNRRVADIQAQSKRMDGLIHDLLFLARADEGVADMVMTPLDFSQTILQSTLGFESLAYEAGKTLSYDIAPDISLHGDTQQMKQLAVILIDNAIKHSNENGNITVQLSRQNGKTVFSVKNTGEGICRADQERIFDRFYRTDASRSSQTGGYGLGLSIARSIVEAHGGKLEVYSEPGKSTTFAATFS